MSPTLFDFYLDELIKNFNNYFIFLAFTDYFLVITESKEQVENKIKVIEDWFL